LHGRRIEEGVINRLSGAKQAEEEHNFVRSKSFETVPRRLKPSQFAGFSGTTEVVPFQGSSFSAACKGRRSFSFAVSAVVP